ncbi:PspA/IM30 family protein [Bradymonas sediminis]|uniref:PspA/IM30 family protein n=1 Tax=Bradymonas sediminis TaxID=1548548 RepID=A0A2Z4FME5_9DELT|nr:PspA/IM30 family protein [Bradymonas sediminis]AWV89854.1 PspA/IM30 family protein [Bradymonas sediminis]TDP76396.1 phage shock protein A (PspA) family protein [Bradymonas sediminis]
MSIFGRMGTLFKANINDVISKAEDPEKILNQLIVDMKEQLISAKKQVAVAIADEKRLKKQYDAEARKAAEWEKKAMLAVRAGRDDLAKEALSRKQEHGELSAEYQKQWQGQKAAADKLRGSLRQLNSKIEEASRKKNLLIARKKRAEAQQTIQQTMSGLNDTSAFDTFGRMAEKIEQMEAEAEASAELAEGFSGDDLASKFEDLEADHGADEALAALKAKMGVSSAAREKETEFSFEEEEVKQEEQVKAGGRGTWDSEDF